MIDIEAAVEASVDDEGVGHGDTFWTHGMLFGVDEFSEIGVVEIGDFTFAFEVHQIAIIM